MTRDFSDTSNGHELHVQQLFVRHQQTVLGYVLSIEPSFADAQDIAQEVFPAVSRKARTWSAGTNFLAWVCTVARTVRATPLNAPSPGRCWGQGAILPGPAMSRGFAGPSTGAMPAGSVGKDS